MIELEKRVKGVVVRNGSWNTEVYIMNICIVDDDKYVVEKIVEGIDWGRLGIEAVYVAYNMKQAKEILNTQQVDILLSDIEMPQGSGLELLEWVREQALLVECIYLSSYAHFAYAQKALQLHSREYLLKPVSNRELENVLGNLVEQMRLTKDGRGKNSQQEKERYWQSLMHGEECDTAVCYGEDILFLCMMRLFRGTEHRKMRNNAVFSLTLTHTVEEFLLGRGYLPDTVLCDSDDCFLIVIRNSNGEKDNLKQHMCELLYEIERTLQTTACIYIGKPTGIGESRERMEALAAMMREGVPDEEGLLFEEEWRGRKAVYRPPDFSVWEQEMICQQDMDEIAGRIMDHVEGLWKDGQANVDVFGRFKADLQQMVFHYMMERDILMNQIFEPGEYAHYCNKASWTLRDMKEFISILFRKLKAVIQVEDKEEDIIGQIIRYIEENLSEDLSRAQLAARAYISEDYLSKKFALHTGMSIPNYVSSKRMEKARDYFKNTAYSVSEVATLVGYTNFSYFSKTFRDYAGCTPNEFRNQYNRNI